MQIASLIRDGKSSKEIADILFISISTVNFHRKNLRAKLGLNKKQKILKTYLLSFGNLNFPPRETMVVLNEPGALDYAGVH